MGVSRVLRQEAEPIWPEERRFLERGGEIVERMSTSGSERVAKKASENKVPQSGLPKASFEAPALRGYLVSRVFGASSSPDMGT